ncbi:MAG: META domain-containing protein [Cyclobacteriaceae bacterium]|jgi:hypothetical protein|nr:hypothetical protein [Cytophagales bacterium]HNP78576.1 META domain-containing protein [Cyclobacteriaceae bacterium]
MKVLPWIAGVMLLVGCKRDAEPAPDFAPLFGHWRIASITPAGSTQGIDTGNVGINNRYVMEFTSQFTANYSLEVNSCSARFTVPGAGRITFENLGCTKVCCDPPLGNMLATQLTAMTYFSVSRDTLFLSGAPHQNHSVNSGGEIVLVQSK